MKSTSLLLSAIVLTKNEEKNIEKCLHSLTFCDEVIVIDDHSHDHTTKLSKQLGAKVFKHKLNNNFAAQRNYGLQKARGKWVLFIDADEVVSLELAKEINSTIRNKISSVGGYYLRRVDVLWNKPLFYGELATFGAFGNGTLLRLGQRSTGTWSRKIHETWNIEGETRILKNLLYHYPHQTYTEFVDDIAKRSELHARVISHEKKTSSLLKVLVWPLGKFLYNYLFKLGFLDGERGFILAMTMSFHSFISWSYLCLTQKQTD